jgi:hypothetical protein
MVLEKIELALNSMSVFITNVKAIALTWMLEFPSNDTAPLIQLQRKVSIALYPLGII